MRKPRKIGVREVAARAGVSFSTAAAALRGENRVRAVTRERVLAAAKELGYQKDRAAALLASRRRGPGQVVALAYIFADFGIPMRGRFENRLVLLERMARREGYALERYRARSDHELLTLGRRLKARGFDGIIIGPTVPDRFMNAFPVESFSIISESAELLEYGVDVVRADHFHSIKNLLDEVIQRGYRRILVLTRYHIPWHPDDDERLGAVACYAASHGSRRPIEIKILRLAILGSSSNPETVGSHEEQAEAIRRNVDAFQPDTVIGFGGYDYHLLHDLGCQVPDGVAYAAMLVTDEDHGELAGLMHDQLCTPSLMIDRLTEKIRLQQKGARDNPTETVVPLPFQDGRSLPSKRP